jgi:hypothetical protein
MPSASRYVAGASEEITKTAEIPPDSHITAMGT